MWRKIKYLTITSERTNLKTFDIPTDTSVQWNKIKTTKKLEFKTIDDPILIDQLIADRNAHHLNQADGTPFTIEPLLSLIGKDTFTTLSQELLEGKANLSQLELSQPTKLYMQKLKQKNTIVNSPTNITIPYKKYVEGFKNWKEKIPTSPSGRHLGHHKCLLKPDGNQYSKEEPDFGERMMKLHHTITSTALLNASPLHRWLTSIVLLLPKVKGQPKIHRLRIINTYESEYNLILKYFWPRKGMQKVEENNGLGDNATGGRKDMNAIETATLNELIIESHILTRHQLCIHQDDAMGCYDRIIRTHTTINSRKFGIPDNICKLHQTAHDRMGFRN